MYQKSIAHVQGVSKQMAATMESLRIMSELLYFTLIHEKVHTAKTEGLL